MVSVLLVVLVVDWEEVSGESPASSCSFVPAAGPLQSGGVIPVHIPLILHCFSVFF